MLRLCCISAVRWNPATLKDLLVIFFFFLPSRPTKRNNNIKLFDSNHTGTALKKEINNWIRTAVSQQWVRLHLYPHTATAPIVATYLLLCLALNIKTVIVTMGEYKGSHLTRKLITDYIIIIIGDSVWSSTVEFQLLNPSFVYSYAQNWISDFPRADPTGSVGFVTTCLSFQIKYIKVNCGEV